MYERINQISWCITEVAPWQSNYGLSELDCEGRTGRPTHVADGTAASDISTSRSHIARINTVWSCLRHSLTL